MADTVRVIFEFPDEEAAHAWLDALALLGSGTPTPLIDGATVTGTKRNGPQLAKWLTANPGWHRVATPANRAAALKAAYKINRGDRRGFESGEFEARARLADGAWIVEARLIPKRRRAATPEGMSPLFGE
ncbi:hypothetical protein [Bifidobacterium parmae]|uniref:Uncharacterized protein n=1 Tax=Bifidobacterium parmae TaxID=361854 RepID=A0A2N5IW95_9BIFI|nr:hypothetical protein [Bifidobacterium parmae]PLS26233.1 hypothetical protein Uis4E_1808 [Bifidobacterium parmae]